MRVQERCPWNLTASELGQCRQLTFPHGAMQSNLRDALQNRAGRTFFVKDGRGKILGWALVTPHRFAGKTHAAMFFVAENQRRHGYGSQMLRIINRRYKTVQYYPWDDRSTAFFSVKNRKVYPIGPHTGHKRSR